MPERRPSELVSFPASAATSEEGYEAHHFVVDVPDLSPTSLSRAVRDWAAALGRNGTDSLLRAPELQDREPWFGFGVRCGTKLLDEATVVEQLGEADPAPVEAFVRAVIAFNEEHHAELAGALATHEELETGSGAAKWLLLRDLRYLDLYIDFIATLDLDHTVAQVDTILALANRYTPAQVGPLKRWAEEHDARLLNDWLEDDRAWKKASDERR